MFSHYENPESEKVIYIIANCNNCDNDLSADYEVLMSQGWIEVECENTLEATDNDTTQQIGEASQPEPATTETTESAICGQMNTLYFGRYAL